VIGKVDDRNRALIDLEVRQIPNSQATSVTAWIDTAFDGHLVFPLPLIQDLQLQSLVDTEAILADGTKVTLETFVCYLDWFGQRIPLQVIANDGKLPLLGTGLLDNHVLHVDYVNKELTIY
jgi:clan AA aspartic protease